MGYKRRVFGKDRENDGKRVAASARVAKSESKAPKVSQRAPKVNQKGAKGSAKGEPNGDKIQYKINIKRRVSKNVEKGGKRDQRGKS